MSNSHSLAGEIVEYTVETDRVCATHRHTQPRTATCRPTTPDIGGVEVEVECPSRCSHNAILETGPNAISTLLQPPIVRTGLAAHQHIASSGYKAPTTRDIPPVALTNITHVDTKAFHPYLAQVGSLYEAFQRARSESEAEGALFRREKDGKQQQQQGQQRPSYKRRTSGQHQRRPAVTPLSTIPAVYSEPDFHLENPRTFDIVSEQAELVREANGPANVATRKSLATNAILQEKLSWYMDTVEVHLIASISSASKSFFSALGSLHELHSDAADAIARIQKLRASLAKLDKDMAIDGLKVVNLKRRRRNVRKLAEAIMQLDDLVALVRQCDEMVACDEIDAALDDLDRAERLIAGSVDPGRKPSYEPRDLRNLQALEGAQSDLDGLRQRIGRGFEARFHRSLLNDIRSHVARTETSATLQRWGDAFTRAKPGQRRAPSVFPSYVDIGPALRADLEAALKGLTRARYSTPAATAFRAVVLREMKTLIRKRLPSSTDDDNVSTVSASTAGAGTARQTQMEKSSVLARNLRALDPDDWIQMLADIYANTSEALRRLSAQVKVLLDITSSLPDPPAARSPQQTSELASVDNATASPQQQRPTRPRATSTVQAEIQQALDLSSLLGEGVDLIQNQLTKVVRVRAQQNAELPLPDFLHYFTLNRLFADECEAISGQSGFGLKTAVDAQIKDFVAKHGDLVKQKLMARLDADRWDAKDFGPTEIAMLDHKVRPAMIDDNKFILPDSGAAILSAIESLEHLAAGIPSMSSEVAITLIDTLKLFNSRSSQLILGAGATRSAGLKNITTKHLALSSQALAFTLALVVPYVRDFFRRHLPASAAPTNNILAEFDNVRRRITEHQAALYEKLIEIMSSRAAVHVRSMKAIDWDTAPPTLVKETTTLQRVLAKHLPDNVVMAVMGPVFASYRQLWERGFGDVELRTDRAKERMLDDVRFLRDRISKLEGAGDLGDHLLRVVMEKEVLLG
ncbi:hypothetical protein DV738_g4515, partial [Chaetothyriales sp. CBS 135597]